MTEVILKKIELEHKFSPMLQKVRQLYALEHPEVFNNTDSSNKTFGGFQ